MSASHSAVTEADILSEVIAADEARLDPALARYIIGLRFPSRATERLHELADKNRDDALTEDERAEMERYLRVGSFLSLMQSKARQSLRDAPAQP